MATTMNACSKYYAILIELCGDVADTKWLKTKYIVIIDCMTVIATCSSEESFDNLLLTSFGSTSLTPFKYFNVVHIIAYHYHIIRLVL